MPLVKGCQPGLGWVTAVLCFVSMEDLKDVRVVEGTSSAGSCPWPRPGACPERLTCWVWIVTPQVSPDVCRVFQRQKWGLI